MTRAIIALILLAALPLHADPKGWDVRIKQTRWQFENRSTLDWARGIAGYDITLSRAAGSRVVEVAVSKQGAKIYGWNATAATPIAIAADTLFYVSHSEIASGATVIAVDLRTGKQSWSARLTGLGPISHSQYLNHVWFAVEPDVIVVQSVEASGKYIELVDRKTGKSVANRVVMP
jgi:outer membrane protein assembly factor BamB